jgi:hypothetical protein
MSSGVCSDVRWNPWQDLFTGGLEEVLPRREVCKAILTMGHVPAQSSPCAGLGSVSRGSPPVETNFDLAEVGSYRANLAGVLPNFSPTYWGQKPGTNAAVTLA